MSLTDFFEQNQSISNSRAKMNYEYKIEEFIKVFPNIIDGDNQTHLHHASSSELFFKIFKILIDEGADVNAEDKWKRTPIHYACNYEVLEILINKGADVNAKDDCDMSPLHCASMYGRLKFLIILLKNGANVDDKDEYGKTSLHFASLHGRLEIVKMLIDKDADVNALDDFGNIPLHYASGKGHLEIVKLLVENGALLNSLNNKNRKPIDLSQNEEIGQYLSNAKQMISKHNIHSYFWVMVYYHPSSGLRSEN